MSLKKIVLNTSRILIEKQCNKASSGDIFANLFRFAVECVGLSVRYLFKTEVRIKTPLLNTLNSQTE
jgi:hypothetical protein